MQLSVLGQWREEILKFTAPGNCIVMLHYQDKRATTLEQVCSGMEELHSAHLFITRDHDD